MSNIKYDENELRKEVLYAIDALYGYNVVLIAPYKALELLVKKKISLFEEPINICLGLVVNQLRNAVRISTQKVSVPIGIELILLRNKPSVGVW